MPRAHVRLLAVAAALTVSAPVWAGTVVVATRDLRSGHPLTAEDVREVVLDDASVPPAAIRSLKDVVGRVPTAPFYAGDFLREERLAVPGAQEGVDSVIPFTHTRVDLPARPVTDLYRVGQHVDVIWTRPTLSCLLLQDVLIVGVQNTAGRTRTTPGSVAAGLVFSLTPAQKFVLEYAQKDGVFGLAIREPGDIEVNTTDVCPKADARAVTEPLNLPIGQSIVLELAGIVPTGISVANGAMVGLFGMGEPGWVHMVGKSPGVTTLSVDLRPNGPHLVYDLRVFEELAEQYTREEHPADWWVLRENEAALATFDQTPAYIRAGSDIVRVERLGKGQEMIVARRFGRTDLLVRLPGEDESKMYGIDVIFEPMEVPKLSLAPKGKLTVPVDRPVVAAATLERSIASVKAKGTKVQLVGVGKGTTRLALFFADDPVATMYDVEVGAGAP